MKFTRRPEHWYSDICIGVRPIVKVGSCKGIIVPKRFFESNKLKYGSEYIVVLLERTRSIVNELTDSEKIQYERFKAMKEDEKQRMERAVKEYDK